MSAEMAFGPDWQAYWRAIEESPLRPIFTDLDAIAEELFMVRLEISDIADALREAASEAQLAALPDVVADPGELTW